MGPGECGKDTCAQWLSENTPLRFGGSTSTYLVPLVARHMGLTVREALKTRRTHRSIWYEVGRKLRDEQPGYLVERSLARGEIVAGLRDFEEVEYVCRHQKVDHILWVDRRRKNDISLKFTIADCFRLCEQYGWRTKFHVIPNQHGLPNLKKQLALFCKDNDIQIRRFRQHLKSLGIPKLGQLDSSVFLHRLSKTGSAG